MKKVPPQNLEAEQSLLGALLIDKNAIIKVIDLIDPSDFFQDANNVIFKGIIDTFISGQDLDILTLTERLSNQNQLDRIGGRAYLVSLTSQTPSVAHIEAYAKVIKDKSLRRQLLQAQMQNIKDIEDEAVNIDTVLATTQNRIVSINSFAIEDSSVQNVAKNLEALQDEYTEKKKQGIALLGISSGIRPIDDAIDGLRPGHVWIVGAYHGTGKTQFSLNLLYTAINKGIPCSFLSLEMSSIDLLSRLIGIHAGISAMKVLKGIHDQNQYQKIQEAKDLLNQSTLHIHTKYFDIDKICMVIRKDVYSRGVKLFFLDYIQQIIGKGSEYETISIAATRLAGLARELKVTIVILSQISNEAEKGGGAGGGFKGSGTLEASADFAIRLLRNKGEEAKNPQNEFVPVDIRISKNKFGYSGTIQNYVMYLETGRFSLDPTLTIEHYK